MHEPPIDRGQPLTRPPVRTLFGNFASAARTGTQGLKPNRQRCSPRQFVCLANILCTHIGERHPRNAYIRVCFFFARVCLLLCVFVRRTGFLNDNICWPIWYLVLPIQSGCCSPLAAIITTAAASAAAALGGKHTYYTPSAAERRGPCRGGRTRSGPAQATQRRAHPQS